MRFENPHSITCPHCSVPQKQPVKALLNLDAQCIACGEDLSEIGARMRELSDDVRVGITLVEIALAFEEKYNVRIDDDDLDAIDTIDEFAALVCRHSLDGQLSPDAVVTETLASVSEMVQSAGVDLTPASSLRKILGKYGHYE